MLIRGTATVIAALGLLGCNIDLASRTTLFGASASGIPSAFTDTLRAWDENEDGIVTCAEWAGYAATLFDLLDLDRNGALTRSEFQKLVQSDPPFDHGDMAYFDADKDARVSRQEFLKTRNPVFAQLDRDDDCALTRFEQQDRTAYEGGDRPSRTSRRKPR